MNLESAFPSFEPGIFPLGTRVLIQLRTVREKSSGGIILASETKDFNKNSTQLGKVIYLGPIAFRNRESGELWKEGVWCRPGDYIRVPRWGGDRFSLTIPGTEDKALFAIFSDHELIAKVDPSAFSDLDEIL